MIREMRLEEIGDDRRGGEMNINKEWLLVKWDEQWEEKRPGG